MGVPGTPRVSQRLTERALATARPRAYIVGMAKSTGLKERQELQAKEGKVAWAEYQAQAAATRTKMERLRALRLAKLAAEVTATTPKKVQRLAKLAAETSATPPQKMPAKKKKAS